MAVAGGVMVVLSLPPRVLNHRLDGAGAGHGAEDPERYAVRAAVQVRAAAVGGLGPAGRGERARCASCGRG